MAYGEFDLRTVEPRFGLTTDGTSDLFGQVPALPVPPLLRQLLDEWTADALAVNTEKSRSESTIAPIFEAAAKLAPPPVQVFSGTSFDVDRERGLTGTCNFALTWSPQRSFIRSPVVCVAEAERDNVTGGYGQCAPGVVAARNVNERDGGEPRPIYGVATSGTIWKFLLLDGDTLRTDVPEHYLPDVAKIVGVLVHTTSD